MRRNESFRRCDERGCSLKMSEKDKESLIKKEKSRLRKVFSEIDPNKLKIIKPLIERAAFMTVSCEELEKIIAEKGYTEAYQNGENQKGIKKTPETEIYNAMAKNLNAIVKQLVELCPAAKKKSKLEELMFRE